MECRWAVSRLTSGGTTTTHEDRAIRRLSLSRGVTYAGGNGAFWALSAILYQQSHAPTLVAAAALASFSVPAALSPFAGALGDHFDRKRVMVGSELAGAACFLGLAFASAPAALLSLRVLASVASAPLVPATSAALPSLVADRRLERANAALSKAGTAGALAGPAIAGLMLATVGGGLVFVLNTITFLISALLIASTKGDFRPSLAYRGHLAAGFAFLRRNDVLRPVTLAYGLAFIGVGVSVPAEIVIATDFGAGSLGYGALIVLWGIGAIFGAMAGERLSGHPRQIIVLAYAAGGLAVGLMTVSLAPIFATVLLGMAIGGLGDGLWEVRQNSLIQRCTPDGVRSRVLAGNEAMMQGGIALGLLVSGLVIGATGAVGAFAVAAGAAGTAAVFLLLISLRVEAAAPASTKQANSRLAESRGGTREREPNGPSLSYVGRPVPASQVSANDFAIKSG
jgi:MFS family permease